MSTEKEKWLYAYDRDVRKLAKTQPNDGQHWSPGHMYYSDGLTPRAAALRFLSGTRWGLKNHKATASKPKKKSPTLESILDEHYGVDWKLASPTTIEWSAARLASAIGVPAAAKQWKRLNARRHKIGRVTTIPQYGSPMFDAYFAERRRA